jgi:hypothetical protein
VCGNSSSSSSSIIINHHQSSSSINHHQSIIIVIISIIIIIITLTIISSHGQQLSALFVPFVHLPQVQGFDKKQHRDDCEYEIGIEEVGVDGDGENGILQNIKNKINLI